ncbi:hypothetical protein [Oceanithermus sp.]|uniref:hypothetical protein n=1 Tax=Oceanithermus sp. TaxID=2268145 RepID=UPI0025E9E245|nr:hypothetical protein [Oceanithermus sp.]
MKTLWIEGEEAGPLRDFARAQPHPYRLYETEGGFVLELVAVAPSVIEKARTRFGGRVRELELAEEGCRDDA